MKNKLEFWFFVFFPTLLLAAGLLAFSTVQQEPTDGTVTNAIDRTELMTREIEYRLPALARVTSYLFGTATIQGYEGLFEGQVLKEIGLVPRPGANKQACDQPTQQMLQAQAIAHTFYSPFAFLPETYVIVQRRPLVTEPPFARDFPATILMLPMTEGANSVVEVIDCGLRVFMVPMSNAED